MLYIIYIYTVTTPIFVLSPLNHQLNCLYKVHNICWEIHFRNHNINNKLKEISMIISQMGERDIYSLVISRSGFEPFLNSDDSRDDFPRTHLFPQASDKIKPDI